MSEEPQQPLKLEQNGDGFLLSRVDSNGERTEMALTEAEAVALVTAGRLEIDRLLEQRRRGTKIPRLTIPVAEAVLNTDLHKTALFLMLIDPAGNEFGFVIQRDTAKALAERLPARVAEIDVDRPKPN